jgi:hypothetical protein
VLTAVLRRSSLTVGQIRGTDPEADDDTGTVPRAAGVGGTQAMSAMEATRSTRSRRLPYLRQRHAHFVLKRTPHLHAEQGASGRASGSFLLHVITAVSCCH